MALTGTTNEEKIWNFLYKQFPNKYSVAGIMGNLYAESALKPNNLQDTFNKKLNMTDEEYTKGVDETSYHNFIRDGAGYGLAQWTFWTRKQALLQYAREKKVRIDNLEMQLEFLVKELLTYEEIVPVLKNATSVLEASNIILTKFEAPANQSQTVKELRASYGMNYYNKFAEEQIVVEKEEVKSLIEFYKNTSYATYYLSDTKHYISNSGSDERGAYRGGSAGDQTGNEWTIKEWYNRPWNCVLRYPDKNVSLKIAELGIKAALNNKIGYDQNERDTYWKQLQKSKYDPSKITTACEADCSSGIIANVKAVGYLLNISNLKDLQASYTGDMEYGFQKAGFQILKDTKYLSSNKYLMPGDILLNTEHHTATNLTLGSASTEITTVINPNIISNNNTLRINSKGKEVEKMQKMLIAVGYGCGAAGADGDFGENTLAAVRAFQRDNGLVIDGVYGEKTKTKLEAAYKNKKTATFIPYTVKVTAKSLNIRKTPSNSGKVVGKIIDNGIYTIVDKSGKWGKLKSGAGWINLNYVKKVN